MDPRLLGDLGLLGGLGGSARSFSAISRVRWRLRRISRCFLTWRRMSSARWWIAWSISGWASLARRVLPFTRRIASATILSVIRGLRSSRSSTSSVARSETCFPTRANLLVTASLSSSSTSTFTPRISILTDGLLSRLSRNRTPVVKARLKDPVRPSARSRAREDEGDDPLRPAAAKRPRARPQRRARRVDVVDEQHRRGARRRPCAARSSADRRGARGAGGRPAWARAPAAGTARSRARPRGRARSRSPRRGRSPASARARAPRAPARRPPRARRADRRPASRPPPPPQARCGART